MRVCVLGMDGKLVSGARDEEEDDIDEESQVDRELNGERAPCQTGLRRRIIPFDVCSDEVAMLMVTGGG